LQEAFLRAGGGRAMLLPRIIPIAEGQEDLSLIAGATEQNFMAGGDLEIPPAISELDRRLALSQLVLRWSEVTRGTGDDAAGHLSDRAMTVAGNTPAQAFQLAGELAQLMDMVETENVSLAGLAALVPETLSQHWQHTLDFLKIITEFWPAYLAEQGCISPAERRNRLILAEAHRYAVHPPAGPVIVAGATGSIPATAELMRRVASLPQGAIVLPALDTWLDEESWNAIGAGAPEHPQFGLKKLLGLLGVERREVSFLPGAEPHDALTSRNSLVSEALRPASTTGTWTRFIEATSVDTAREALEGLTLIEAPNAQDEAEAVALILREALETPGRTAALISPDRLLARRVAIRLEAWGIRVDDSAGRPFAKTVPGAFLDSVIEAVATRFAPAEVMSLLKHPLCRLGLDPFAIRRAARALELAAFRGAYLGDGLAGIEAALEKAAQSTAAGSGKRPHPAVRRLFNEDWDGARDLIRRLRVAFAPLIELYARWGAISLKDFANAHCQVAMSIAEPPASEQTEDSSGKDSSPLWTGEAGEFAHNFFEQVRAPATPSIEIGAHDYADLYRSLVAKENIRPRVPVHARLAIWGPFEARLQQPDIVILGSLNESTWPEAAEPGAWLNRPMRESLGLPSPEEKIGHSAHDFSSLLCAKKVFLTRALKVDGVPTVPSRWLMRLDALLAGWGLNAQLRADKRWITWARRRDQVKRQRPAAQPEPRPDIALRPRKLSVSRIEAWIGNPYAIFARDILELEPLEPLGKQPGADVHGSIIHAALARFTATYPETLPSDPKTELLKLAREAFAEFEAHPRVAAFWMPRFERFAEWFAATEAARRNGGRVIAETSGSLVIPAPAGPFVLTARADRIDIHHSSLTITDYKTGAIPKDKAVKDGLAPQLPLEAAIAAANLFAGIPNLPVGSLKYVRASGATPPGEEHAVSCDDLPALAANALKGLENLIAKFDDPQTPYRPLRRARFTYRYDDYAHLARIAEWSVDPLSGEED
jgi:ATP-dependent helicase/nuclease subunit B